MANATPITWPWGSTSARARVAGGQLGRQHQHVAAGAAAVVDVAADGRDLLGHPERADLAALRHRGARTPRRCRRSRRRASGEGGRLAVGAQHREVAVGVERHDRRRRSVPPVGQRRPRCSSSPATTWALVTTRSVPTTKPLPSWMREQASPSTLTVDCTTWLATVGRQAARLGRRPGVGRGRRASNTCGERLVADEAAQRRPACRAGRGAGRSTSLGDRRAAGLRRPSRPGCAPAPAAAATRRPARPRPRSIAAGDLVGAGAPARGQLGVQLAAEDAARAPAR